MGDILHALPAVTALRQAHPDWVIDWVVEPRWRALLAAMAAWPRTGQPRSQPLVDRLHLRAHQSNGAKPRSAAKPATKSTPSSRTASRRLRCRPRPAGRDPLRRHRSHGRLPPAYRRSRTRASCPRAGSLPSAYPPMARTSSSRTSNWPLPSPATTSPRAALAARRSRRRSLGRRNSSRQRTQAAVLINPGAGWGAKRWPVERYAAVAKAHRPRLPRSGQCRPRRRSSCRRHRQETGGAATPLPASLEHSSPSPAALLWSSPATPARSISPARSAARSSASTAPPIPAATAPSEPDSKSCAAPRAAATTPATQPPKPACSPSSPKMCCRLPRNCFILEAAR